MANGERISRRDFLKFTGLNLAALTIPAPPMDWLAPLPNWSSLPIELLPDDVHAILKLVPQTKIGSDGYALIQERNRRYAGRAPQAVTQWNQEHCSNADRLDSQLPWGIVLHWYGDKDNFDRSVKGYLRGFNSLREVDGEILRTSAHFLVGDAIISPGDLENSSDKIGILQTQAPARDGTPYVASHLRPINYQAHQDRKQYFVRALYQLGYQDPRVHSLLQDLYDGPKLDPNMRTLAVEITGYNFDKHEGYPSKQKIANVISLVWALMKRYQIPATNLLGHHEIQLSKADPGKKFMSLIRYLIGVKALVEQDIQMKKLVFGQFISPGIDCQSAVVDYFKSVRDYLIMVSTPHVCYEWEAESKFWHFHDHLQASKPIKAAQEFNSPFSWEAILLGDHYLQPENHEGVDLHIHPVNRPSTISQSNIVQLIADGVCEFIGHSQRCRAGQAAIFRHRQPDGAEILSIYSHLVEPGSIQTGKSYPIGYRIGRLDHHASHSDSFLHFAIAYGASWDLGLRQGPDIPLNAGTNWIKQRYLQPLDYLSKHIRSSPEILSPKTQ